MEGKNLKERKSKMPKKTKKEVRDELVNSLNSQIDKIADFINNPNGYNERLLKILEERELTIKSLEKIIKEKSEFYKQDLKQVSLDKIRLRRKLQKYTIGSVFLEDNSKIEPLLKHLNIFKRYIKICKYVEALKESKKSDIFDFEKFEDADEIVSIKNTIEILSGMKCDSSLRIDVEADYRVWCLSILKHFQQQLSFGDNYQKLLVLKDFNFRVLDMVNLELKKNKRIIEDKRKSSVIILIKKYLLIFYNKVEEYDRTPSSESRLSVDGNSQYEDFPINKSKLDVLENQIEEVIIEIKTNIDLLCDELEKDLIVPDGDVNISSIENLTSKSFKGEPIDKDKDLIIEED